MKNLKNQLFFGLALMLVLSSCTIEKRMYMPGYHVEWNKSKHSAGKSELSYINNNNTKLSEQNPTINEESLTITNTEADEFADTEVENSLSASADNNPVILPFKKLVPLQENIESKNEFIHSKNKVFFKKKEANKLIVDEKSDDKKISSLAIAGFVCSLLGFFLVLIVRFPFLLGTLGVIISALALGEIKNKNKSGKGFAIAGLVLGIVDIILFWFFLIILGLTLLFTIFI
jgi:hypothetical protein